VAFAFRSTLVIIAGTALALLSSAPAPSVRAASTDDQVVASFYPDSLLRDPVLKGQPPDIKSYQFVRADLDGSGSKDYLVVAYYNGVHDTVRVLKAPAGAAATVAGDLGLNYIGGGPAQVSLIDLDGDGKPEIDLIIPGRRMAHWLFKWSSGTLKFFGPAEVDAFGRQHTILSDLRVADIDGDGIPELLVPKDDSGYITYKLVNGAYAAATPAAFYYHMIRDKGDPDALDVPIEVPAPGDYIFTIINGDARGSNRTTAAYAEVNGTVVFPESAFKKADRVLTALVTLGASNELYFELRGAPGSEVTVAFTKKP
jgi:hypothetical protein